MTTERNVDNDPFADPENDDQHPLATDSTLNVGRNASLTLGTDSLVVLGMVASTCEIESC